MKKYNSFRGEVGTVAPNLLERDFKANKPNRSGLLTLQSLHYSALSCIFHPFLICSMARLCHNNLSYHPNLNQVTDMHEKAFAKIPDNTNLIFHSDQGWQYQHKHYQKMLKEKGIRQSMSRKGNCLDNACALKTFSAY